MSRKNKPFQEKDKYHEIDMYHEDWSTIFKIYGCAFGIVLGFILPWGIGIFILGKWIFFN